MKDQDQAREELRAELAALRQQVAELETVETERKRAEEELRHSEERLRILFEYAPDGYYLSDLKGCFVDGNRAAEELVGCERNELIGKSFLGVAGLLSPDQIPKAAALLAKSTLRQPTGPDEFILNRKDGTRIPVEVSTYPVEIEGRTLVLGIARDITERKRPEEALRESEEYLRGILESQLDLVVRVDPEGHFTYVNDAYCKAFGKSREELLGETFMPLVHPEDLPATMEAMKGLEVPPYRIYVEQRAVTVEGWRWLAWQDYAIQDAHGQTVEIQAVGRDITQQKQVEEALRNAHEELEQRVEERTAELSRANALLQQEIGERKRAEEALRESEAKYRGLYESSRDGISHVDMEGHILDCNQAFLDMVGYTIEEVRQLTYPQITDEKWHAMEEDITANQVLVRGFSDEYEKEYIRKDGTTFPIEIKVWLIKDDKGQPAGMWAIMRDITKRKQMEEQLRQSQKMEAIGLLAGGIAHDFNNLLTAINGFAELMQYQLAPGDPLYQMTEKILTSGRRAADLTNQLLGFSRKQMIQPKVLDLNTVIANMDEMLRRLIREDIEMETVLSPDLWPVKVDPTQIEQVAVNLAVNARDAMVDGGKLTIKTANAVLDADFVASHLGAKAGEHVMLAVSDTGVGISQEVQAHIFEPFFTTKEVGKGTGLGLATVYGIVKQNNGYISVNSQEGQGSTFSIYLPRAEEAAPASHRPQVETDLPSGSETILVVEDNQAVRELVRMTLQEQGYTLLEAEDGREALRLAADHSGPIHLLLTDVVMPGMSGKALAERLATTCPELRVIFMSGHTDDAIARHGVLGPGVAFLQKPFNPSDLARKARDVLDA